MNSTIAFCIVIVAVAMWLILIAAAPWTISDQNSFLRNFVNHEYLNFMGVIVAITVASASNLYIEVNKFEEKTGRIFTAAKRGIRQSVYGLLWSLALAIVIVVVKPLVGTDPRPTAAFNGGALLVIAFAAIVLTDIVQAAFKLDPNRIRADDEKSPEQVGQDNDENIAA